ncbi:hypothetical protein D3C87_1432930 [compost metagenome]
MFFLLSCHFDLNTIRGFKLIDLRLDISHHFVGIVLRQYIGRQNDDPFLLLPFNAAISIYIINIGKRRDRNLSDDAIHGHITISYLHISQGLEVIPLGFHGTYINFIIIVYIAVF